MTGGTRHSVERGDVVLCNLPPYSTQPWLSMGVVLHAALLTDAGVTARVVRPIDAPFGVPEAVLDASLSTLAFDPSMDERLEAMERAHRAEPAFFEQLVDELLIGGEAVIGLSVFRNNVDVTLHVAKLIKARRGDVTIVIGGPEAVEDPAELLLPDVDVVVGAEAERVLVPLVRALLERAPADVLALRNVWTHDRQASPPGARAALPIPPLPVIDYAALMRLFVGDPEPTVPLLMNWGCPYSCSYCSNRVTYSRFTEGPVERVLAEMDGVVRAWRALHGGSAPPLGIQLSDATTNALPRQHDRLLEGVVEALPRWGMRPSLRGQTLFDSRVTAERVALWNTAGFDSTFFGLDVVNDAARRDLKRPGNLAQVEAAVETYLRGGGRGLGVGLPVGIPGTTDAHFEQSERFVEWALSLGCEIQSFTVLPYVFFQSAQDPALVRLNHGPPRGVLWRSDAPGGDPAVRARRFMRLFDLIDGRAPALSPIPPYLILPAMLPDEAPDRLERWMERHGRVFDQIQPGGSETPTAAVEPEAQWARALATLKDAPGPWRLRTFEYQPGQLRAIFERADREQPLAMLLEERDPERRSFAHTEEFNVSYQTEWRGEACDFDAPWLTARVSDLSQPPPPSSASTS